MRKVGCLLPFLVIASGLMAQSSTGYFHSDNNLQYGFSLKASLLIDGGKQQNTPYFRIGADIGIGSGFIDHWLYESVNLELQLYNNGLGMGNRGNDRKLLPASLELLPAFTLTAGWPNRMGNTQNSNRYVNLYYFSNYARPALQNPFDHSVSVGTVVSIVTDPAKKTQRIGFLDFNIAGGLQLSYYNDGAFPFAQLALGDGYDRYQTGGGMLSYNGPRNTLVNDVELAYHKYTGYSQSTFEASNKLFLAYMDYFDSEQRYFNRSMFDLSIGNPIRGCGIQLQQYNSVKWDLQHDIHTDVLDTYHMVPYTPPYVTFGLTYYGLSQQTSSK